MLNLPLGHSLTPHRSDTTVPRVTRGIIPARRARRSVLISQRGRMPRSHYSRDYGMLLSSGLNYFCS